MNPCSAAKRGNTAVQHQLTRMMIELTGVHRTNQRNIIRAGTNSGSNSETPCRIDRNAEISGCSHEHGESSE
jgi:hypothetical protein